MERGRVRYSWVPAIVLASVALVDQTDVSILRGVLPLIKDDWHVSDFQLGALGFAFVLMHSIAAIPAGWMADRYRRTRIVGSTMLTWSALSALAAGSVNYANLFAARALLGIGQSIDDPSSTAMLADYYPPRLRGRVFSIQQVTTFVGAAIGLGLGGFVGSRLGWRWAFLCVGTPGVVVALLVFRLREPLRGESEHLEATGELPVAALQDSRRGMPLRTFLATAYREVVEEIRGIFAIRTMRYILVGIGTLLFSVTGLIYWLAVFHDRYSGMTLTQATGATGGVLGLGGILGTLYGGRLADRVYGRGPTGRILMTSNSIIISTVLFVISFAVPQVPLRFVIQFVGTFIAAGCIPALRASMADVIPASSRGVGVSAFSLVSAIFGQALAPPVVGLLSDVTSLRAAFFIISPPLILGALIVRRAKSTISEDAGAILQSIAARSAPGDGQEIGPTAPNP
jgi:MFS family permease